MSYLAEIKYTNKLAKRETRNEIVESVKDRGNAKLYLVSLRTDFWPTGWLYLSYLAEISQS